MKDIQKVFLLDLFSKFFVNKRKQKILKETERYFNVAIQEFKPENRKTVISDEIKTGNWL